MKSFLSTYADALVAIAVAALLALLALGLAGCRSPSPVTPDEAPTTYQAEACQCPDFAITDHPEDPDEAPGTWCLAKSRTGQWMPAEDHPACRREARERAGEEG